jgi:glycine cleavage system transcriptional repressor
MSNKQMVLTAVGPDAPGRVKQVSSFLLEAGCNLEDSRMAMLADEFALIVLFSGEPAALARVEAGSAGFADELGFLLMLKEAGAPTPRTDCLDYSLRVRGVDQPGVFAVSDALAVRQVNVVSLDSRVEPAAFSGTPMFVLNARLQVPGRKVLGALREALELVCDDMNLSYVLDPVDLG